MFRVGQARSIAPATCFLDKGGNTKRKGTFRSTLEEARPHAAPVRVPLSGEAREFTSSLSSAKREETNPVHAEKQVHNSHVIASFTLWGAGFSDKDREFIRLGVVSRAVRPGVGPQIK